VRYWLVVKTRGQFGGKSFERFNGGYPAAAKSNALKANQVPIRAAGTPKNPPKDAAQSYRAAPTANREHACCLNQGNGCFRFQIDFEVGHLHSPHGFVGGPERWCY
jgi:hypothetical protein